MDNGIIHIRNDTFRADITVEGLHTLTLDKLRKLFKLILTAEWENRDTIIFLNSFFPQWITAAKDVWHQASVDYNNGFRLPKGHPGEFIPAGETRKRKAENKRLMEAVKAAKASYDKWVKIYELWNTSKTKFKIVNL